MATSAGIKAAPGKPNLAFLSGGFRPFFLLGSAWAIVVLALFGEALVGSFTLPAAIDPIAWHRHEMLFGYLGAVVGGFLLTAVPNWTGRRPITGVRLLALVLLWAAARLAILYSGRTGIAAAALLDSGFLLVMAAIAGIELYAARNRNVPVVLLTVTLAIAAALDLAEAGGTFEPRGMGYRLGIGVLLTMVMLIGGRLIPTFTRNWLVKRGLEPSLPSPMQRFDIWALTTAIAGLLAWVIAPEARATGYALAGAGLLHLVRLARWQGWRTGTEPLVTMLHVAYLWVPVGLLLLGLANISTLVPASSGLHALTAGAFAGMTLAVMTRASLGHTGRELHADLPTIAIYLLITTAALVRVAAPMLPTDYMRSIHIAAIAWMGAFALFLLNYGAMLVRPRADGKV